MGFIAKRLIKQDLNLVDVLIQDTQNEYFNVVEMPTTFTQGRSAFKIFGSEFLKRGVPLKMEILDAAGDTVYLAPVDLVGEDVAPFLPYRFVTVEIYRPPINTEGLGKLTILGEIDPSKVNFNIPNNFQGTYNVKFNQAINIDLSTIINTQPIRFYKNPRIEPQEIVKARIVDTPITTTERIFTSSSAEIRNDIKDAIIPIVTGSQEKPDGIPQAPKNKPAKDVLFFKEDFKFKAGVGAAFPPILKRRGIRNLFASPEPEAFTLSMADGGLKSNMQGATITIPEHTQTVQKIDEETGEIINEDVTVPAFETKVLKVIDEKKFVPEDIPFIPDPSSDQPLDSSGAVPIDGGDVIIPTLVDVPISMSFEDVTTTVVSSSVHFDSFMDLTFKDLRTFSGDVYKLKVHGKMQSSNAGFNVMGESIVESPELLIDTNSHSGFLRTGYFATQSLVDSYWTGSSYDGSTQGSNITLEWTGSQYIDSLRLSGSNYSANQTIVVEQKPGYEFRVERSVPYTLLATVSGITTDKEQLDGTVRKEGKLFFHLSGSNLNNSKNLPTNAAVGGELTDVESGKVVVLKLDENIEGFQKLQTIEFTFNPRLNLDKLNNTDTIIQMRADSGRWHISDMSLRPAMDSGFSPDEYNITVPLPRSVRPDKLDVFVEYFDINNNTTETITAQKDIEVLGSALIIDGDDNLLTGSLFMGNVSGEGIEMAGANSAFMRSVGYGGFISASAQGHGGFMIFSGSVLPDSPDDYKGAGLEIHDGVTGENESYFKFRTNPSVFDVKTKTFFIGGSLNFISGSQGNLEISSSGFHVSASSIVADNFTFKSGVIKEDVSIEGTVSANSIVVPVNVGGATTTEANASASISNKGFAKFVSASIGGFVIDDSSISTKNYVSNAQGLTISTRDNGFIEVENAKIRGTLKTTVFEKESVNAVGGQLYVANSTTITGSQFLLSAGSSSTSMSVSETTMSVANSSGFVGSYDGITGEILQVKKVGATGFNTEYMYVQSQSRFEPSSDIDLRGFLYVVRGFSGSAGVPSEDSASVGDSAGTADTYSDGQVVVSTGRYISGTAASNNIVGTGFIRLNVNPNDVTTPYIDISERTGSSVYAISLKARLGDLSGLNRTQLHGQDPATAGFGLYSRNVFLEGGINANTGSIAGVSMNGSQLFIGTGTYFNSNTPFYVSGKDSADGGGDKGDFSLGDKLKWDSSAGTLSIIGTIDVATALGDYTSSLAAGSSSLAGRARLTATGLDILDSSSNVIGSYGTTMRVGFNASDKSALRIASDGSLTIGTSGTQEVSIAANGSATFSGDLSAAGGTFSGNLSAAGGTFSGNLSAAGGTFSGNLSAAGGSFTGVIDVGAVGLGATTASLQNQTTGLGAGTASLQSQTTGLGTATGSLLTASASLATRARISSTGLELIDTGGTLVSSFGTSVQVGVDSTSESALRIGTSGNLSVGTSQQTRFSVDASGNVSMAGKLFIGGGTGVGQTFLPIPTRNGTRIDNTVENTTVDNTWSTTGTYGALTQPNDNMVRMTVASGRNTSAGAVRVYYELDQDAMNLGHRYRITGEVSQSAAIDFFLRIGTKSFGGDTVVNAGNIAGSTGLNDPFSVDYVPSAVSNPDALFFFNDGGATPANKFIDIRNLQVIDMDATGSNEQVSAVIGGFKFDGDSMYSGRKTGSAAYTENGSMTIGGAGYISAPSFSISEAGNAKFKGQIELEAQVEQSDGNFIPFSGGAGSFIDEIGETIGGDAACVLRGTKIVTKRGEINVEDTKGDDIIRVYDWMKKEWEYSPIDKILNRVTKVGWSHIKTKRGYELKCSNSHLLYHPMYPGNAIKTDELGVGGQLYVVENDEIIEDYIESIKVYNESIEVWNYELEYTHNYISNGILSHNALPKDGAFTGTHKYFVTGSTDITSGDAVKLDSDNFLVRTTSAKDTTCIGIATKTNKEFQTDFTPAIGAPSSIFDTDAVISRSLQLDSFGTVSNEEDYDIMVVASLGDNRDFHGYLSGSETLTLTTSSFQTVTGFKICNQGGLVSKGDLLCTSDTDGYLMKQPVEYSVTAVDDGTPTYEARQNINSFTVGKTMESCSFDSNGKVEGVYGYLYCG